MKIDSETAKILGLDHTELQILSAIEKEKLTIAQISVATEIPRTSLYYMLPKLAERKFVRKINLNRKIYWQKNPDRDIKNVLQNALNKISNQNADSFTNTLSRNTYITFHYGAKNVAKIFEEVSSSPTSSRWHGIQPGQSILDLIPKVPTNILVKFNKKVKEKRHIVEGIVHEGYIDKMKNIMKPHEYMALLESFWGRSADYAKLPDDYMTDISSEIYLFDSKVAIVNWKEEFAIIIRNEDVFNLLIEMFRSTKYMLSKYDQNEKIARKLVDIKKF